MFVRNLMASGPRCLMCLMFMPSGPVELWFVLFEIANYTCVVVSHISMVERFLIIWSMCLLIVFALYVHSDVGELFIKSFCFVYVSNGCFWFVV